MKVKIVRQVITEVEEILSMTPEEYCDLRSGRPNLLTPDLQSQNLKINVVSISPFKKEDEEELDSFFFNKNRKEV